MKFVITGSIAFDYLMSFPGRFRDHILPDQLDRISLSFLVDTMVRRSGGVATNIAYTMALLGESPLVMATVGKDFGEYGEWLEERGVDTSAIQIIPDLFTASFFVNTDSMNAQIASFYTGAMARASDLHFSDLSSKPDLAVISPNDPQAMQQYVQECDQLDIDYFYDPSQQIVRLETEVLKEGIIGCRALFANDYELALIQERTGLDCESILNHAAFIVITLGEEGVDVWTKEGCSHTPAVPPERIKDPTGAGDAFRGGFFTGYLNDFPLERCAQMGVLASTYSLEYEGPQGHSYDLPTFTQRFREHFDDDGDLDQLG
ncbi:MAG: carbohydrate kinase family protein [Anaerolineales bacterium]|nr:carbohydrate kinase family protein [Anaerolineales bacterium]